MDLQPRWMHSVHHCLNTYLTHRYKNASVSHDTAKFTTVIFANNCAKFWSCKPLTQHKLQPSNKWQTVMLVEYNLTWTEYSELGSDN